MGGLGPGGPSKKYHARVGVRTTKRSLRFSGPVRPRGASLGERQTLPLSAAHPGHMDTPFWCCPSPDLGTGRAHRLLWGVRRAEPPAQKPEMPGSLSALPTAACRPRRSQPVSPPARLSDGRLSRLLRRSDEHRHESVLGPGQACTAVTLLPHGLSQGKVGCPPLGCLNPWTCRLT